MSSAPRTALSLIEQRELGFQLASGRDNRLKHTATISDCFVAAIASDPSPAGAAAFASALPTSGVVCPLRPAAKLKQQFLPTCSAIIREANRGRSQDCQIKTTEGKDTPDGKMESLGAAA